MKKFLLKIFNATVIMLFITVNQQFAFSQTMLDTIELEAVAIFETRTEYYTTGTNLNIISSNVLKSNSMTSLSEILTSQTSLTINSYGANGLSGISVRGGLSAHTAVLWNGINIQSPANGGVNFSIIPTFFIDALTIQHGGSGTLFGSGAASGIVHLNNSPELNKGFQVTAETGIGCYEKWRAAAKLGFSNKKTAFNLRLFHSAAENNFEFINTAKAGDPIEKQKNAAYSQQGISMNYYHETFKKAKYGVCVWILNNSNQIQTEMTQSGENFTSQDDFSTRALFNWNKSVGYSTWNIKSAFFSDSYNYKSPLVESNNGNGTAISQIFEIENKTWIKNRILIHSGWNTTFENCSGNGYTATQQRFRNSLFVSGKFYELPASSSVVVSFREEASSLQLHPIVYSIGIEMFTKSAIELKAQFSKNYRIPTFNDLFWKETAYAKGNTALKPENVYNTEIGATHHFNNNFVDITSSLTAYYSLANDLIVWTQAEDSKWLPLNKKQVKTNGLEVNTTIKTSIGSLTTTLRGSYTLTNSKLTESEVENDGMLGMPLRYIPKHKATTGFEIVYRKFNFSLQHSFTGKRYYDYIHYIDNYNLTNLSISYEIKIQKKTLNFSANVKNLFNTEYQVMAWYAMPLRNYYFQISINY